MNFIQLKLEIYEIHIFELRNEEINVKKILAVIYATYAVALITARIFFTFISSFRSSNI